MMFLDRSQIQPLRWLSQPHSRNSSLPVEQRENKLYPLPCLDLHIHRTQCLIAELTTLMNSTPGSLPPTFCVRISPTISRFGSTHAKVPQEPACRNVPSRAIVQPSPYPTSIPKPRESLR